MGEITSYFGYDKWGGETHPVTQITTLFFFISWDL